MTTTVTFTVEQDTATLKFNRPVAFAITGVNENGRVYNASKSLAGANGYAKSWAACGVKQVRVTEIVDGQANF